MSEHGNLSVKFYENPWHNQPAIFELSKEQVSALVLEWEALVKFRDKVSEVFHEIMAI